jgi:hypothetical protein
MAYPVSYRKANFNFRREKLIRPYPPSLGHFRTVVTQVSKVLIKE